MNVQTKCWFCREHVDKEDYLFDSEFDTALHEKCLVKELKDNPKNFEAQLMTYLLTSETKKGIEDYHIANNTHIGKKKLSKKRILELENL